MSTIKVSCHLLLIAFQLILVPPSNAASMNENVQTNQAEAKWAASYDKNSVAAVEPFTGAFSSLTRDIQLEGGGDLDITIFRKYDTGRYSERHSSASAKDWERLPLSAPFLLPGGWSITGAPSVTMSVSFFPYGDFWPDMNSVVERVCSGANWRANGTTGAYGIVVSYMLTLPTGDKEGLVPITNGVVRSRSGWELTCPGGTYTLKDPSGGVYTMSAADLESFVAAENMGYMHRYLRPTKKTVPHSNGWIKYDYSASPVAGAPLPSRIYADDGRSLTLYYESTNGVVRLRSIRDDLTGDQWTYTLDATTGQLVSVQGPEGLQWKYVYWGDVAYQNPPASPFVERLSTPPGPQVFETKNGMLKSITFPEGGSISLDYSPSQIYAIGFWWTEADPINFYINMEGYGDETRYDSINGAMQYSIRTKTVSRSDGGVDSYTYIPSRSKDVYDVTVINRPTGEERHSFIGEGYFSNSVDLDSWDANSPKINPWTYDNFTPHANQNSAYQYLNGAWKLGQKVEASYGGGARVEKFEWMPRVHSAIYFHATSGRISVRDDQTLVGDLSKKTVTQDGLTYISQYSNYDAYGNEGTIVMTSAGTPTRTVVKTFNIDVSKNILHQLKDETITDQSLATTQPVGCAANPASCQ
jgi:hypothetical protein